MTHPVSSATTTAQPAPTSVSPLPAPIGIGATQSSISPATIPTDFWDKIREYAGSVTDFIRGIVLSAVEGIRSALGAVAGWLGKTEPDTSCASNNWEIPAETTSAASTAEVLSGPPDPFTLIPITDVDKRNVYTLVHTLGSSSWMGLLAKTAELQQLGLDIQHIHPLKYLDYIFRHPTLPRDMESIGSSSLTWTPFVNGVTETMRRDATTLPSSMTGFARSLNINSADIVPFFVANNWDGLLKFLIAVKTGRRTSVWVEPQATATTTTIAAPSPPEAPTTTTATLAPPAQLLIANLPFDIADDQILTDLITHYAQDSRASLLWNHSALHLQWTHLGVRHPLKLLAALYLNPTLIAHLQTISSYWGTKALLIRALTHQFSGWPLNQVRPYINDFATICHLDPLQTHTLIQNGNWSQVLDNLVQSHGA